MKMFIKPAKFRGGGDLRALSAAASVNSPNSAWGIQNAKRATIGANYIQMEAFVILGRTAARREGKRIHFARIECFFNRMDALVT